ncbi:MAG TPA: hypothetical protein VMM12_07295, partial [Longimicrobiales bacterium]|nr:hypothetical protein [Longimicrobiales bacterium]
MRRRGELPATAAAATVGAALGIALFAGGALLLYAGQGFLTSAGLLVGVALAAVAAGVWVGGPEGPGPGHRRMLGRWMLGVVVLGVASFAASAWLRVPAIQTSTLGPPLGMVLFLAEPAYALAALLAALEARRRGREGARALRPASGPGGA